jgi:hypothetical protein
MPYYAGVLTDTRLGDYAYVESESHESAFRKILFAMYKEVDYEEINELSSLEVDRVSKKEVLEEVGRAGLDLLREGAVLFDFNDFSPTWISDEDLRDIKFITLINAFGGSKEDLNG